MSSLANGSRMVGKYHDLEILSATLKIFKAGGKDVAVDKLNG